MEATKTREQRDAEFKAEKDGAFQRFMAKQETQLMVSLIPKAEPPEAVEIALRNAFDAGHNEGSGSILSSVIDVMFKSEGKRRDGY